MEFMKEGEQGQQIKQKVTPAEVTEIASAVEVINAEDGQTLGIDDVSKTIPRFKDGWSLVNYNQKVIVNASLYINTAYDENKSAEVELAEDYKLEVYEHAIDPSWQTDYINEQGHPICHWSAFDILYNPNWKKIVARFMGGLTDTEIAIVRILKENTNNSANYLSLYTLDDTFTKAFQDLARKEREAKEDAERRLENGTMRLSECKRRWIHPIPLEIRFNEEQCMSLGGQFATQVQAFRYAYQLNGNKSFAIIEQLYDSRTNGQNRELISKQEPKTEMREEFNIFSTDNLPESIFTNYRPQVFICDFNNGDFVIQKKR